MGTSVATELMARDLRGELGMDVRGALLFNGSMLLHLARPTIGQKLLRSRLGPLVSRLTTERGFRPQFSRIFSRAPAQRRGGGRPVVAARPRGRAARSATSSSTTWPSANASPSAGTARSATGPGALTLTWGLKDPVARVEVLEGLRELRPGVEVIELPELAHYPQIEAPRRIAAALDAAMRRKPRGLRQDFQRAEDAGVIGVPEPVDRIRPGDTRVQQRDLVRIVGHHVVDVVVEVGYVAAVVCAEFASLMQQLIGLSVLRSTKPAVQHVVGPESAPAQTVLSSELRSPSRTTGSGPVAGPAVRSAQPPGPAGSGP